MSDVRYGFSDMVDALDPPPAPRAPSAGKTHAGSPGTVFAQEATTDMVVRLLERAGLKQSHTDTRGLVHFFHSVDGTNDKAVTVYPPEMDSHGQASVSVWSSDTRLAALGLDPGAGGRGYDAWQLFGILEHGGDFTAAAKELAAQGYGDEQSPRDRDREAVRVRSPLSMLETGKLTGGSFIRSLPEITEAVWGGGTDVVWAKGEPLMLASATGLGKTTLSQALFKAGHRIDGMDAVLGLPVVEFERPSLYVAADRPAQIARAMRRIVKGQSDEWLDKWLQWYHGAPLYSLSNPEWADQMAEDALAMGVGQVFIDSLKDVTTGLISDEVGQAISRAINRLVAEGIEVVVNHHTRKGGAGDRTTLKTLEDIYGSNLITGSLGSVIALNGKAGDTVVTVEQLKFPDSGGIDQMECTIDKELGILVPAAATEFGEWMRAQATVGFDTRRAAQFLYKGNDMTAKVDRAEKRRIERVLDHHIAGTRAPTLMKVKDDKTGRNMYRPVIDDMIVDELRAQEQGSK